MSINLFIPAAGYGTRLKPLTDHFPKPLLPIAGIPLIQRIIESVQNQVEINKIGINTHYLPEVVGDWAEKCPMKEKIEQFHETDILGTGGALMNAAELFKEGTCLLANGDVINGIDWQGLLKFHKDNNNLVTLAVQDRTHERRVGVDADNNLVCIDQTCSAPGVDHWYGYACAAVYEPEFLGFLPEGESHVVPFWVEASQKTGRVRVFDIGKDTYWLDIGNPESFTQAVVDTLAGEERFFKSPLEVPFDCQLDKTVVIEGNVKVGESVSLENVILLPGSELLNGSDFKNAIVTPEGLVSVEWPEVSDSISPAERIGNGGSDRIYSRENGIVKLKYSAFEQNIDRQIFLTEKLRGNGVNVPGILTHNSYKREVSLEDLGDTTFKDWLTGKTKDEIDVMLKLIFDQLYKLHFSSFEITDKVFNCEVLCWETSYFLERFIQRICQICEDFSLLKEEFLRLAIEADKLPKAIMHRDFQSENIMIKDKAPWFIDFQAAHHGPPFFDLVSLLADPYIEIPEDLVLKYKNSYLSLLGSKFKMSIEQCERAYTLCGLQRHMQALGAYGFLSTIRGRKSFMEHIPSALKHLASEAAPVAGEFPELVKLIKKIKDRF